MHHYTMGLKGTLIGVEPPLPLPLVSSIIIAPARLVQWHFG